MNIPICGSVHPKELAWHCQCRKDPGHEDRHRCYGCGFEWAQGDTSSLMPDEIDAARAKAHENLGQS